MSNIKFLSLIMNNKFNIIKEVNTTQSIMSNKEKIYVSNVLIKTINCCNINYHNLINGKKIVLKEMDENKEIKQIFAKQNKRSKKLQRESANSINSKVLNIKLIFSQFYDTLTILNNVEIDNITRKELEFDLFDIILKNYKCIDTTRTMNSFINLLTTMCNTYKQKDIIFNYFLIQFISQINFNEKEHKLFFDFLISQANTDFKIDISCYDANFYSNLFKTSLGLSLGIFLLLKNYKFADIFIQIVINPHNICQNSIHFNNFLILLNKYSTNNDILKKLYGNIIK